MRFAGSIALSLIIISILIAGCTQPASEEKIPTASPVMTVAGNTTTIPSYLTSSQTPVVTTSFTGRYIDVHSHIRPVRDTFRTCMLALRYRFVDGVRS